MTLVVCPIDLENPLTQPPWQSLITPPPLALPGFPHEASSVLSLCQLLLRTIFSAHVALLHWQPMPHQHIIDFLGKSI